MPCVCRLLHFVDSFASNGVLVTISTIHLILDFSNVHVPFRWIYICHVQFLDFPREATLEKYRGDASAEHYDIDLATANIFLAITFFGQGNRRTVVSTPSTQSLLHLVKFCHCRRLLTLSIFRVRCVFSDETQVYHMPNACFFSQDPNRYTTLCHAIR